MRKHGHKSIHTHNKTGHKRTNIHKMPYKTWISWTWSKNRNTNRFLMLFYSVKYASNEQVLSSPIIIFLYWIERKGSFNYYYDNADANLIDLQR